MRNTIPFIVSGLGMILILVNACSPREGQRSAQGTGIIMVETDSAIDPMQLSIQWVSPKREAITVFENGEVRDVPIPHATKDLFEFSLANVAIGSAGISRSKEKNTHDFHFKVFKKPNERDPFIHMMVNGPDSAYGFFVKRYKRDLLGDINREEFYGVDGLKSYETFSNFDRSGELVNTNKYEYTYDVWGYKASQEHYSWSPDGALIHRARNTFRHDEAGNMLEMTYTAFEPDGKIKTDNTNRYSYNPQGLVHEREFLSYDPQGSLVNHFITEYIYNDKGTATQEILYDANRRRMNMLERTFDEAGALVKEAVTDYHTDGRVKSVHGREYDAAGKVLREF